jgi:predicted transposase YbfD/YdcC
VPRNLLRLFALIGELKIAYIGLLHWVKDVVLSEDKSPIRAGQACANLSIIRTIVINILRRHGYASVTKAQRLIAHDLDKIFLLLQ